MTHHGLLVYDIEADGLLNPWDGDEATKVHCICATDHSGQVYAFVNESDLPVASAWCDQQDEDIKLGLLTEFNELVKKYDGLACHNQLHYDLPMLEKFIGLTYDFVPQHVNGHELKIIDTLVDSRWLYPDRPLPKGCPSAIDNPVTGRKDTVGPHSLMAWTYRTSGSKPIVHDWRNQPIYVYLERCIEDAKNNLLVFNALNSEMAKWYRTADCPSKWKQVRNKAKTCINVETVFSHVIFKQQQTGVGFNREKAESYLPLLDSMIQEVRDRVEPKLPRTKIPKSRLTKDWAFPKNPFKNDGVPSANFQKWLEKHDGCVWWDLKEQKNQLEVYGKVYDFPLPEFVKTHEQLTLYNSAELKKYLMEIGWKPVFWNYKKDPKTGRAMRDENKQLIQTTPRLKDAATGMTCPNLLDMDSEIAKDIILFNSLKHRRQTVKSLESDKGYLNHPRLEVDGRLPAQAIPCGAGCFTADTLVLTENGHRTWFGLEIGDKVVTHKSRLRKITDKFVNGYKPVFRITLENGIETRVTGNHPFLIDGEWIRADELSIGDKCLAYPTKEVWKQWRDEPVLVSSWGRVRSLKSGKEYKSRNSGKGRQIVDVGLKDGKFRSFRVARLVLESHGNFDQSMHCLHKNDLAFDDYIGNLYGGTDQDNANDRAKYRVLDQTIGRKSKLTEKDINYIVNSTETSKVLAKKFNVNDGYIRQIKRGERRLRKKAETKIFSAVKVPIKNIECEGYEWTYGLTIEEDESHLTDGIFTHNTRRVTHRVVANVPKADDDVVFGKELRALFYCDEPDYYFVGYDASAIEARLEGNEAYPFDKGEYARILLEGDIHTDNANLFSEKSGNTIKRGKAKGIKYALTYGAGPAKIATMLDVPVERAKEILEDYWQVYWAVSQAKDKLTREWNRNNRTRIKDIMGGPLWIRSEHSIFNYRLQNAGTSVMKLSAVLMYKWLKEEQDKGLARKVIDYHDEAQWEAHKSLVKWKKVSDKEEGEALQKEGYSKPIEVNGKWFVADSVVGRYGIESIRKAGEILKIKVPLTGEWCCGKDWSQTH